MKLGKDVQIVRGVTNFDETRPFYDMIGYTLLEEGISPMKKKFAVFSDGTVNFLLTEDTLTYTGLIYFDVDQRSKVLSLEENGVSFFWKMEQEGMPFQGMFEVIPGIFAINLVEADHEGKNDAEFKNGKFGEFAIPVADFKGTESFMQKLGFETRFENEKPYHWGILQDGNITLGLHQTIDFDFPVPTYFDEKMEVIIDKMVSDGLEMQNMGPGNAKVISPDGQVFFFFKGKI